MRFRRRLTRHLSAGACGISFKNRSRARANLRSISASSRSIGAQLAGISLRAAPARWWKSLSAWVIALGRQQVISDACDYSVTLR